MDQVYFVFNQFILNFKNYLGDKKAQCFQVLQQSINTNDDKNTSAIEAQRNEVSMTKKQRHELQKSLHEIARDCERQVLHHSGLDISKDLESFDVTLKNEDEDEQWIHTVACGKDPKKPKLVLVHGFAASSLSYYKMLMPLSQKYEVYAIDLPGMGLSSKPEWNFQGPEPVINFFVESIEQWRTKMNIEKFTLVGHSLGGYISGNYALQHPDRLDKVVLLSSAGVTKQTDEDIRRHMETSPLHYKLWFKVFDYIWTNQMTFNKLYSETKILPAELIMRQYMKMLKLPSEEYESWSQYMDKMLKLPESGEKAVFNMLQFPRCNAFLPLEQLFPGRLKVPVHFCYGGQLDWMCSDGAKKLIQNKQVEGTYTQFDHFDHQFTFFNPQETAQYILNL
ncbi:hypothetical protein ABPG74_014185 [Tetrahymena malaccensis]